MLGLLFVAYGGNADDIVLEDYNFTNLNTQEYTGGLWLEPDVDWPCKSALLPPIHTLSPPFFPLCSFLTLSAISKSHVRLRPHRIHQLDLRPQPKHLFRIPMAQRMHEFRFQAADWSAYCAHCGYDAYAQDEFDYCD